MGGVEECQGSAAEPGPVPPMANQLPLGCRRSGTPSPVAHHPGRRGFPSTYRPSQRQEAHRERVPRQEWNKGRGIWPSSWSRTLACEVACSGSCQTAASDTARWAARGRAALSRKHHELSCNSMWWASVRSGPQITTCVLPAGSTPPALPAPTPFRTFRTLRSLRRGGPSANANK